MLNDEIRLKKHRFFNKKNIITINSILQDDAQ